MSKVKGKCLPSSAISQKLSQIQTSAHEFVMPYLPVTRPSRGDSSSSKPSVSISKTYKSLQDIPINCPWRLFFLEYLNGSVSACSSPSVSACHWNCAGCCQKRFKRFADRDLNATANILLIGTCKERPLVFARSRKRKGSEEESVSHKKTKLSLDAERTLSDHIPLTYEDINGLKGSCIQTKRWQAIGCLIVFVSCQQSFKHFVHIICSSEQSKQKNQNKWE